MIARALQGVLLTLEVLFSLRIQRSKIFFFISDYIMYYICKSFTSLFL